MQRTNYLKIMLSMALAGLMVFAAFKVDSHRKESATKLRILQHVERSLDCYRTLETYNAEAIENEGEYNDNLPPGNDEVPDCAGQGGEDSEQALKIVSDLQEKTELLINPPEHTAEKNANDEDENFLKHDFVQQLVKLKVSLPFTNLWLPEFSTSAYDSLTASGNFYLISSVSLIEELTKQKLAQERLALLEHTFRETVTSKLHPVLDRLYDCQTAKYQAVYSRVADVSNRESSGEEFECSAKLADQKFATTLRFINDLLVRTIALKKEMETSRKKAIAAIDP